MIINLPTIKCFAFSQLRVDLIKPLFKEMTTENYKEQQILLGQLLYHLQSRGAE